MSLINDALKKAQSRQGDTAPPAPIAGGPAALPGAPRKGKTPLAKLVLICVGVAFACTALAVTLTLFLVRKTSPTPSPLAETAPAARPGKLPAPSAPSPTASSPAAPTTPRDSTGAIASSSSALSSTPATLPHSPTPATTQPAPTPGLHSTEKTPAAPVADGAGAAPIISPHPVALIAPANAELTATPSAPTIKLSNRIQAFIDRLRITSIRISDTGNKAILNDRLFRAGDLVEPTLGLRLTTIQPSLLTFTDESGLTYLRHF